ncbi:glycoside hydrolase family 3 C-terminal domain-containing protein [Streptomyces radiopugnans]|uniref:glycoside hydrolase family 3 C-terminal domain-containing protein n=1 Tax=Streptomyces radiopugnans TaxID=403935 RepID=UPI003F1D21DF
MPTFRNSNAPLDERVSDLVGRLTLDEKLAMLHQYAPAVPRLGLAAFRTGTEVLHGLAFHGEATVFPQAVGLAATWNPELLTAVGEAVANEVRERHDHDPDVGLNVWGPVVNLLRDPRWGRNEEGYSEDPRLTAELATAYTRGLSGPVEESTGRLTTAPTLKHFLAYNNETDKARLSSQLRPRVLREYDIRPFEWTVGSGTVSGVMPSYNKVNGRPSHLSPYFQALRRWHSELAVFSDAYGPIGTVEDSGYYEDRPHAYAAAVRAGLDSFTCEFHDPTNTLEALRSALSFGLLSERDIDRSVTRLLAMRMRLGEFDETPAAPRRAEGGRLADSSAHRDLARAAARQAVVLLKNAPLADGHPVLPLNPERLRRVSVVGPFAEQLFSDWYSGNRPYEVTLLQALRADLCEAAVHFVPGVDRVAFEIAGHGGFLSAGDTLGQRLVRREAESVEPAQCFDVIDWGGDLVSLKCAAGGGYLSERRDRTLALDPVGPHGWRVRETFRLVPDGDLCLIQGAESGLFLTLENDSEGTLSMSATDRSRALGLRRHVVSPAGETIAAAARDTDAVIVTVGTHPLVNGGERYDRMDLGLAAAQEAAFRAALEANPATAVVIFSGHPVTVPDLTAEAPAMLWTSHGAQETGRALADILLGRYSPTGRLQQTWYRSTEELGSIFDYDIIKREKTYLYFRGTPLFSFGHGLSYSSFHYGPLELSNADVLAEDRVDLHVRVANSGPYNTAEVVQLYVQAISSDVPRPVRELLAFRRVEVAAGTAATVSFSVPVSELAFWDVAVGRYVVASGEYRLMVGRSCTDIVGDVSLKVRGAPSGPRSLSRALVRAVDFDDYEGIEIVDETKVSGDAVQPTSDAGWLLFRDVDLEDGIGILTARLTRCGSGPAAIRLRLDHPTEGSEIAVVTSTESSGVGQWNTLHTPVTDEASGRRNIYLVLDGPVRLASFILGPTAVS